MAAIASAEFIADLERTVRADPARFTQMLHRAPDLFAATASRLPGEAG